MAKCVLGEKRGKAVMGGIFPENSPSLLLVRLIYSLGLVADVSLFFELISGNFPGQRLWRSFFGKRHSFYNLSSLGNRSNENQVLCKIVLRQLTNEVTLVRLNGCEQVLERDRLFPH